MQNPDGAAAYLAPVSHSRAKSMADVGLCNTASGSHIRLGKQRLRTYGGKRPADLTKTDFTGLFAEYGRVRSSGLAHDIFSGRYRGFGFIEMEGHEARAAISALNGHTLRGNCLRGNEERPRGRNGGRRRR